MSDPTYPGVIAEADTKNWGQALALHLLAPFDMAKIDDDPSEAIMLGLAHTVLATLEDLGYTFGGGMFYHDDRAAHLRWALLGEEGGFPAEEYGGVRPFHSYLFQAYVEQYGHPAELIKPGRRVQYAHHEPGSDIPIGTKGTVLTPPNEETGGTLVAWDPNKNYGARRNHEVDTKDLLPLDE